MVYSVKALKQNKEQNILDNDIVLQKEGANKPRDKPIPFWEKYTLTIKEASEYFGIGETRLRQLIMEHNTADFVLMNGSKILIKRKKFEEFIDESSAI